MTSTESAGPARGAADAAEDNDAGVADGCGRGRGPAPLALDTVLPPVDSDVHHFQPAPPSRDAYLALLVTLVLEAVVPSLQCYWGVLLVMWGRPAQDAAGTPARLASLLDAKASGLLWTPVLFTASWSAADPWSDTLAAVHGLHGPCSLVGALLLTGGLLLTALGALLAPQSPLLPTLAGTAAGIAAGAGASLLSRSSRLVLDQRWGARAGTTQGARRFLRALGLTMTPMLALAACQSRAGAAGALLAALGACLPALLAPLVLGARRTRTQPEPADTHTRAQPDKYERIKEMSWRLGPRRDSEAEVDARTEISDDGGSVSGQPAPAPAPAPPSNPGPHAAEAEPARTRVVAEVHCDVSGARQQPGAGLTLSPDATARLASATARLASATAPAPATNANGDPAAPRPLFGEDGQAWNIAYSFDCDGDDDIELFVRRVSPRRGRCCCGALRLHPHYARGCRADLRPALRPAFHLALLTLATCRLAGLALPVLLPALALLQTLQTAGAGPARARIHLAAALPAVSGVGAMLFGLAVLWESSWEFPGDTGTPVRARRRFLSVVSAVAASGFVLLSRGHSRWWLMLGSLTAGFGTAGAVWAQRFATREALGGAASYRAQPLLGLLTALAVVILVQLCDLSLVSCMEVLAGMHSALSALWLLQPYVARSC